MKNHHAGSAHAKRSFAGKHATVHASGFRPPSLPRKGLQRKARRIKRTPRRAPFLYEDLERKARPAARRDAPPRHPCRRRSANTFLHGLKRARHPWRAWPLHYPLVFLDFLPQSAASMPLENRAGRFSVAVIQRAIHGADQLRANYIERL